MYEYTIVSDRNKVIAKDQCAFGSLTKVIDFYGEQNFRIIVEKVVDQKENTN